MLLILNVLQVILALLFVFLVPGFAIITALFPRNALNAPERLLLSITTSITVDIIGGLVLNVSPWGLQSISWFALLFLVSCSAILVAWFRMGKLTQLRLPSIHIDVQATKIVPIVLAIMIAGVALRVASTEAPSQDLSGYTLLWMLPATNDNPGNLRVGIDSREFTATTYRLEVKADGRPVYEWPSIQLTPEQSWESVIDLARAGIAGSSVIEADLYRLDSAGTLYRHVELKHAQFTGD